QTTPQRRHSTSSRCWSTSGSRDRMVPMKPVYPRRFRARPPAESSGWQVLQVKPRLLQVELAMHRAHGLVADHAVAAQGGHCLPLGLDQVVQQLLVGGRLLLDRAVAVTGVALGEAVAPEPVHPAQPLGGLL